MNYELIPSDQFEKDVKRLIKKFKLLKQDLIELEKILQNNPTEGRSLGNNCYKIRLPNTSVPTGKRGGFRIITLLKIENEKIYLLTLYSKTEKEDILDEDLQKILKELS